MKAEELRIGNIVDTPIGIGSIVSIHDLKFNSVRVCSKYHTRYRFVDVDKLIPVPITPEILEKIDGVIKTGVGHTYFLQDNKYRHRCLAIGYNNDTHENQYYLFIQEGKDRANIEDSVLLTKHLKYLHEFQNWIFMLTQTELQIKL